MLKSIPLKLLAALLDWLDSLLLTARWRIFLAQIEEQQRPSTPWERWADEEGRGPLAAFEQKNIGR